jgi:succinyl-CoA synthetase beta subunit
VRLAKSVSEAEELTRQMLGRTLVTHQTGEAGKQVNRIYIEDGSDIERELYLACWSIAAPRASASSPRPRAAWTSRKSRPTRPKRS